MQSGHNVTGIDSLRRPHIDAKLHFSWKLHRRTW